MILELALNHVNAAMVLERIITALSFWLITVDFGDMSLWNAQGPLLHSGDTMSRVF